MLVGARCSVTKLGQEDRARGGKGSRVSLVGRREGENHFQSCTQLGGSLERVIHVPHVVILSQLCLMDFKFILHSYNV